MESKDEIIDTRLDHSDSFKSLEKNWQSSISASEEAQVAPYQPIEDKSTILKIKLSKDQKYTEKLKAKQNWDVNQLSIDIFEGDQIKLPKMADV